MPPNDKQTAQNDPSQPVTQPSPGAATAPAAQSPPAAPVSTLLNTEPLPPKLDSISAPTTGPAAATSPTPQPLTTLPATQDATAHNAPKPTRPKPSPKNLAAKKGVSTQNSLLISEIRDGLVIMNDGSLRAAIMCQSINFDLMSPSEREAVESSYQGFLNSLYFPIQIFIRSRRVDLNKYIDKLDKVRQNQENILLSFLMEDYIAYMRYLIESSNIMDKQFYIIVPYFPSLLAQGGVSSGVTKIGALFKRRKDMVVLNEANYNQFKDELTQQVQVVLNGLQQMNVQAIPLNTQELIELYYTVYNPQTADNEKLTDVEGLEVPIVGKGAGEAKQVIAGDLD